MLPFRAAGSGRRHESFAPSQGQDGSPAAAASQKTGRLPDGGVTIRLPNVELCYPLARRMLRGLASGMKPTLSGINY